MGKNSLKRCFFKTMVILDITMKDSKIVSSELLDVPYYQQTHYATCGPAALMMVMKYYDGNVELSKDFEYKLWRKTRSIAFRGGTLQFGMAYTAKIMDFNAEIYQKKKFSDYHTHWKKTYNFFENVLSSKVRNARIPIHYGIDIIQVINGALAKKIPPIIFVNLEPITGENVFHWIVLTGIKNNKFYFNDPDMSYFRDVSKKNYQVELDVFKKAIATDSFRRLSFPFSFLHFPPSVVLVYK